MDDSVNGNRTNSYAEQRGLEQALHDEYKATEQGQLDQSI
jgi:hypothetical protein